MKRRSLRTARAGLRLGWLLLVVIALTLAGRDAVAGIYGIASGASAAQKEPPPRKCPNASDHCDCPTPPPPPPTAGRPIDVSRGAETYLHTDLVVNGIYPIRIVRRYDSRTRFDSPLGYGWSLNYDMRLFQYPDGSVTVRSGCGAETHFVATGGGFTAPAGIRLDLVAAPAGSSESYTLLYRSGAKAFFDTEGRLTALQDPQGNRLEMTYDSRGKLPLQGTSPFSVDPTKPGLVAMVYRLTRVAERAADGTLTGRYVDLAYDDNTGRLTSIKSNDGRTVTYMHDVDSATGLTKGNLTQVTGPTGIAQVFGYADPNDPHNLTSIQEGAGMTPWVTSYDAQDRATKQTHGHTTFTINYNLPANATVTRTVTDAQGQNPVQAVTAYTFDADGYPTKIVDALKNERDFIYDSDKNVTQEQLWRNTGTVATPNIVLERTINSTYDTAGNRLTRSVTLDSGATTTDTWTYDHNWVASHEVVSSADPSTVFRTEYTFVRDASGNPINIQDIKRPHADGSFETATFSYNAAGQTVGMVLSDGHQVANTYYPLSDANVGARGRLETTAQVVNGSPDPHEKATYAYDAAGNLSQVTDALGNVTALTFDAMGRLTTITNPLGEETLYTYTGPDGSSPGTLLTQVERGHTAADGTGQVTKLVYDAEGRLAEIDRENDAASFIPFATFTVDSDGNRLTATDGENRTTHYVYDLLDRLIAVTDPAGNTTTYAYDAAGDRTQVIDANHHETAFVYDGLGRLIETDAVSIRPVEKTQFAYDAAGNLTGVTDANGHTTTYAYDRLSRVTSVTQPLGQTMQYSYDLESRLATVVNARGNEIKYTYEPWGPVQEVQQFASTTATTPVRTISFDYDLNGNVTSATDDSIQAGPLYTITYDALNRPEVVTAKYLPGGDRTLTSAYDRFGHRSQLTFADGSQTLISQWDTNKLGQMAAAHLPGPNGSGSQNFTFDYFANDHLKTITEPDGATTAYTYRLAGPVATLTVKDPAQAVLEALTYAYDPVRNVLSMQDSAGTHDFGYDAVDRLTQATHPSGSGLPASENFGYDAVGNRELPSDPTAYAYDANNRIQQSPGNLTYGFDADGNLTSRSDGAAFTYDFINRLRTFTDGSTSAAYVYDPFGRRIEKTVNGTTTWFLWDGNHLMAEYDASGNRTRRYAYAGGFAPIQYAVDSGGSETLYDVHSNALDAPRLLTDASGKVVWSATYEAFGTAVVNRDPDGDGTAITFPIRFPGQYADSESGLHYNRSRSFDPTTGRYIEADPIGQRGGPNAYVYGLANPMRNIDPLGLWAFGGGYGFAGGLFPIPGKLGVAWDFNCYVVHDGRGNTNVLCCYAGGFGTGAGEGIVGGPQRSAALCFNCRTICDMQGSYGTLEGAAADEVGGNFGGGISVGMHGTTYFGSYGPSAGAGGYLALEYGKCTLLFPTDCKRCRKRDQ